MNQFSASILNMKECGNRRYLTVISKQTILQVLTSDMKTDFRPGQDIKIKFEPLCVALATQSFAGISIANQILAKIDTILSGQILSEIDLDTPLGRIHSTIISDRVKLLGLRTHSEVLALIKASDIKISLQ